MPRLGVIVAGNFQDVHWSQAAMELITSASISAWSRMAPVIGLLCNICAMSSMSRWVALISQAPTTSKEREMSSDFFFSLNFRTSFNNGKD
jgi:hypothetical protein